MAGRGQRGGGGGDRVLESRHLVGLFLGVVLLCGVFFTLGYVMGRNQFGGPVHAEDTRLRATPSPAPSAPKSKQSEPAPSSASGDWDFYGKSSPKNPDAAEDTRPELATPAILPRRQQRRSQSLPQRLRAASSRQRWGRAQSSCKFPLSRARATRSPWPTPSSKKDFRLSL